MIGNQTLTRACTALIALGTGCAADTGEDPAQLGVAAHAVTAAPELIASGQDSPVGVVPDQQRNDVYWTNATDGATVPLDILRASKTGGGPVTEVVSDIPDVGFTHLDGDRLYWSMGATEPGVGGIQSRRKRGGPISDVVVNRRVFNLVLSGDFIYFATPDDGGQIQRVAKTGGPITTLATNVGPGLDNIPVLAVSNDLVVFTQSTFEVECDGRVRSVAKTGGPITTLASGICNLFWLEADSRAAYWTESNSETGVGRVIRYRLNGTTAPAVIDTIDSQAMFVAVDADNVYYTAFDGADGVVRRLPKAPGVKATIASGQLLPFSLDGDATHLYWSTVLDGEVKRLAKCAPAVGAEPEPQPAAASARRVAPIVRLATVLHARE